MADIREVQVAHTDIIGGLPDNRDTCAGCGEPLLIENAWMTDGCPCNTPLGVNSLNERRWRLLMELQQKQAREVESLRKFKAYVHRRLDEAGIPEDPDSPHKAEGCRIGGRLDLVLARWPQDNAVAVASPAAAPHAAEDSTVFDEPAVASLDGADVARLEGEGGNVCGGR